MNKLPALQFYPGDWRKDPGVQALSFHDRGVWFEIILLMHESDERGKLLLNGRAMPDEALARLLGVDKQILTTTISTLLTYGVASRDDQTGALMCRRMVRDEYVRQMKIKAGKMGGNPVLLKHEDKQKPTTQDKQNGGSSSSSSTSVLAPDGALCVFNLSGENSVLRKLKFSEAERGRWFDSFWAVVWAKIGRGAARRACLAKVKTPEHRDRLIAEAKRQGPDILARAARSGSGSVLHPATWINQERWDDEEPELPSIGPTNGRMSALEQSRKTLQECDLSDVETAY